MRLGGKVALISGGARGQGAEEARLFAKEGAKVMICDLLEQDGERVAAEINESGGEAAFVKIDVTQEGDWCQVVRETVSRFGGLNVLVNNAGILRRAKLEDISATTWDEVMDVNVKGVFLGTKYAIPEMRKVSGGSIINVSSTAGLIAGVNTPADYTASKGAVRLLTKSTAVQYATEGIRCNSIHPGSIDTDMISESIGTPEGRAASINRIPLGYIGTVSDVAYAALFLASDESSYMTGSELVVDGGVTAQ